MVSRNLWPVFFSSTIPVGVDAGAAVGAGVGGAVVGAEPPYDAANHRLHSLHLSVQRTACIQGVFHARFSSIPQSYPLPLQPVHGIGITRPISKATEEKRGKNPPLICTAVELESSPSC